MSKVPCDAFGCDRRIMLVSDTGMWAHVFEEGRTIPLHRPTPPKNLPVLCAIDGCEFQIAKSGLRWYHVDTHGIEPGHEAMSFEDLFNGHFGPPCTAHPGRENHCSSGRCGSCWLCKEAAAATEAVVALEDSGKGFIIDPVVHTKAGDVPLKDYEGFVTTHPEKGIIPLEDVEPVAAPPAARPTWDNWALGIAAAVAVRADCTRRQVGAVILDSDHRVVATGYNGYPSGKPGCASAGACPRGRKTYAEIPKDSAYVGTAAPCDALHAEENAVLHAHRSLKGCWIYVTHKPCPNCERLLRGTGIAGAKWPEGYVLF